MQHDEVVDALYEVTKQIAPGEDPSQKLIKYAHGRKLAPAQLTRLGQMYNTASTLATMRGADRGASPSLVDVPSLVDGYVEKAAAIPHNTDNTSLDHLVRNPLQRRLSTDGAVIEEAGGSIVLGARGADGRMEFDDMAWDRLNKAAAAPAPTTGAPGLPRIWKPKETFKLANAPEVTPQVEGSRRSLFKAAFSLADREINLAKDAIEELADKPRHLVTDLVKQSRLSGDPEDFCRKLQLDAHGFFTEEEADALSKIARQALAAEGLPAPEVSAEEVASVVLHRDRTGAIPIFEKLAGVIRTMNKLEAYGRGVAVDLAKMAAAHEDKMDGYYAERMENILSRYKQSALRFGDPSKFPPKPTPEKKEPKEEPTVEPTVESGKGGKGETGEPGKSSPWPSPAKAMADATAPARQLLGSELLAGIQRKHKLRQEGSEQFTRELGQVGDDTLATANLQRLMVQDEIIMEQPPEEVIRMFNSIRQNSPEIASNYELLRLSLRGALETQGLDLDTALTAGKVDAQVADRRRPGKPKAEIA